ncbi:MAG: DUF3800 domain-containing protein [Bryobacteraceae bacterium]|jgi:hypothetical protein
MLQRFVEVTGMVFPENTFMAFVQCYVDESGKFKDHQVLSLCGFAAAPSQIEVFDSGWRSLLRANGMRSLHMKKAARFTQPLGTRRPAIGLEERKTALLSFVECIQNNLETALYVAVDIAAFKALAGDERKILGGDPYYLVFQRLLFELVRYYAEPDARVSLICDEEQYYSKRCHEILAKLKAKHEDYRRALISISFADDEFFTVLQAADLFAYLTRCAAQVEMRGESAFQFRLLYDHLTAADTRGKLNLLGGVYGEEQLHELAQAMAREKAAK